MIKAKYYLCQRTDIFKVDKNGQKVKVGEKNIKISEHASQKALDREFDKSKKKDIFKVLIPNDICIGYTFYNIDGEYIGEIIKETKDMWYIKRTKDKTEMDCMVVLKDNIEQKFIDNYFVIKLN